MTLFRHRYLVKMQTFSPVPTANGRWAYVTEVDGLDPLQAMLNAIEEWRRLNVDVRHAEDCNITIELVH